ncbi:MAG: HAD family hydrolase [Ndongobacter sp.]|nr:HAD family hydrolase [Ndongobacter sp.]
MIRLFCTDFDNTLAHKGKVTQKNREAVRRFQEQGGRFAIVTGRMAANIEKKAAENELSCFIVAVNGALVLTKEKEELARACISAELVEKMEHICKEHRWRFLIYGRSSCYLPKKGWGYPFTRPIFHVIGKRSGVKPVFFSNLRELTQFAQDDLLKMNVFPRKGEKQRVIDAFSALGSLYVTTSGKHHVEVMSDAADKWRGILRLAEHLGVQQDEIAAIGDFDNDLPMVSQAGIGFAVENANESIKKAAAVQVPAARDSGVAEALKYVLTLNESGR